MSFQPYIGVEHHQAVVDALNVGWLGMGATTQAFEEGIAHFLGQDGPRRAPRARDDTGTSALHLGLLVAGVARRRRVITPSFNFVSDHQAIVAAGAAPVLCDVDDASSGWTWTRRPPSWAERRRPSCRWHFAGIPADLKALYRSRSARGSGSSRTQPRLRLARGRPPHRQLRRREVLQLRSREGHHFHRWGGGGRQRRAQPRACDTTDCSDRPRHHRAVQNSRGVGVRVVSQVPLPPDEHHASVGLSQLARAESSSRAAGAVPALHRLPHGVRGLRCPQTDFENVSPLSISCGWSRGGARRDQPPEAAGHRHRHPLHGRYTRLLSEGLPAGRPQCHRGVPGDRDAALAHLMPPERWSASRERSATS